MARTKSSKLNWNALRKLLASSLPSKLSNVYYLRIKHWYTYKGPEWTALRLKALWNCALLARSGDTDSIPSICHEARISLADGFPKGIEGDLIQRWIKIQSPAKLRRAAVAFRSYTAIVLTQTSKKQLSKAKDSINSPGKVIDIIPHSKADRKAILHNVDNPADGYDRSDIIGLLPYSCSPKDDVLKSKRLPALSGTSAYPNLFQIPGREKKEIPFMSLMASLSSKGKVPMCLVEKHPDFQLRKLAEKIQEESGDDTYGNIVILQEGGAKGRTICSPNAWIQYYLKPYHDYMMRYITHMESGKDSKVMFGTSCVLDQVHGAYLALDQLQAGSFCHAVDLSSATDRFPLSLQVGVTQELGIPELGQALEELRGPYAGPDGTKWSYGAGQPMGLMGSFPLFHLTHFALLNGLAFKLRLQPDGSNFAVLGDDVLIFDESLLKLYLDTLEEYEVPISWHKSYKGDLVEFAGFILTRLNSGWTAFRPYKMGANASMTSVLNILHAFGSKAEKWSSNWSRRFDLYTRCKGLRSLDLSPLLQSEDHTLVGGSSPGVEWLDRVMNQLLYYPLPNVNTEGFDNLISDAWYIDRFRLCQTQIPEGDPYFHGEIVPTDTSYLRVEFHPEQYIAAEFERKQVYQNFWKDPLIKNAMANELLRSD